MHHISVSLLLVLALPLPSALDAQSGPTPHARVLTTSGWGLGFAFTATGGVDGSPPDIRIPIDAAKSWRIEPQFGVSRATTSDTLRQSGYSDQTGQIRLRVLHFAVMVARLIPVDSTLRFYVGGRMGIVRTSSREADTVVASTYTYDRTATAHEYGLVTGVEFAVHSRLSAGGEVGVSYFEIPFDYKEVNPTYPSTYTIKERGTRVETSAALVMRWFPGKG